MSNVTIEDLYKYFGILADAKEDAGKHVDTYLKIIDGTKAGAKEKQLASQFITRFFKYFSKDTGTVAIDAIFDLCEDDDVKIRKQAIKDLSTICRDSPIHLSRIADILTQLLQTDDVHETMLVQNSLLSAFRQDAKATLIEIYNHIKSTDLDEVRKRAIKFLVAKLPTLELNKEAEELVIKLTKEVLVDVDAEEFVLLIRLLSSLPSMSTLQGRQELVNIIAAQCELETPLQDANDTEKLIIVFSCTQQAIPLFSKNVQSTKFVAYYLDHIFPLFSQFSIDEGMKLEILKCFADISSHVSPQLEKLNERLKPLYDTLLEYLPRPSESSTQEASDANAKFNFSFVECLLFAFHELAKLYPDFLASEENKERLKEFRLRLQYFATGTQNYIKELRNTVQPNDNSQENKVRKIALKVTLNIDTLIKELFHNPPSYKSVIQCSWKAEAKAPDVAHKRSISSDDTENRNKKPERGVYTPPSGKYSTNSKPAHQNGNNTNGARRLFHNTARRGRGGRQF